MNANGLSVLLADDHFLVRRGLAQFLERHLTLERLHEAESGPALIDAAQSHPWDLVITDYSLHGLEGAHQLVGGALVGHRLHPDQHRVGPVGERRPPGEVRGRAQLVQPIPLPALLLQLRSAWQ